MPENDEYAGQGGSYVIDPATGKRQLVERTDLSALVKSSAQDADNSKPEKQGE